MWTRSRRSHTLAVAVALLAAGEASADAAVRKQRLRLSSGITMSYVEAGPQDAPPLILLHGLGDTSRSWELMLPTLSRRYRVYALEQRGHGETEAPACCYALANLANDVVAFMNAKDIEQAAIAGHSMGSFVGQYLASTHPHRVRRLVLLGSSDTTVGTEVIEWLWEKVKAFDKGVGPEFVDEWQKNPTPVEATFLSKVKAETAAVPPHVWRGVARTLMTEDQRRFLRDISVPVLILWGEQDAAFPRAHQDRLRAALPGAVFKPHPRVGHNLHWEVPTAVAEDIRAFLD